MGRKRIPEDDRKEPISIRLPKWLIDRLTVEGKLQDVIEKILKDYFKKKD